MEADPFLEEYTKNSLFENPFNDHITILTKRKSPLSPTITFFSPNDFTVALDTNSTLEKNFSVKSELRFDNYDITKKYAIGYIYILNDGNSASREGSLAVRAVGAPCYIEHIRVRMRGHNDMREKAQPDLRTDERLRRQIGRASCRERV